MKKLILLLIATLIATLIPHSASAKDLAIWDTLQGTNPRGYVLLMRHTLAPGVGDPANFRLGDCSTQRNLSQEGRQDARDIGDWLQRRDVGIFRVESSRWCRAKETAELLGIGRVILNRNLDSLFENSDPIKSVQTAKIRSKIVKHRQTKGLLVLVGHFVNISALTGIGVESGEGVLVRANAKGEIKVMGYSPIP
uniref:histidine phosphatase family protein n=1 Tax=Candidatus Planktophila sp. TaxID=2175601 RepID=UPI004049E60A